jgi:hypothetical protein
MTIYYFNCKFKMVCRIFQIFGDLQINIFKFSGILFATKLYLYNNEFQNLILFRKNKSFIFFVGKIFLMFLLISVEARKM